MNKDLAQALAENSFQQAATNAADKAESMLSLSQQYDVNIEGGKYGAGGERVSTQKRESILQGIPEKGSTNEKVSESVDKNGSVPSNRVQNGPFQMIQSGESDPRVGQNVLERKTVFVPSQSMQVAKPIPLKHGPIANAAAQSKQNTVPLQKQSFGTGNIPEDTPNLKPEDSVLTGPNDQQNTEQVLQADSRSKQTYSSLQVTPNERSQENQQASSTEEQSSPMDIKDEAIMKEASSPTVKIQEKRKASEVA